MHEVRNAAHASLEQKQTTQIRAEIIPGIQLSTWSRSLGVRLGSRAASCSSWDPGINLEPLTRCQAVIPSLPPALPLMLHIKHWFEAKISITYSSAKTETTGIEIYAPSRIRRRHGAFAYHHVHFTCCKGSFWILCRMLVLWSGCLVCFLWLWFINCVVLMKLLNLSVPWFSSSVK